MHNYSLSTLALLVAVSGGVLHAQDADATAPEFTPELIEELIAEDMADVDELVEEMAEDETMADEAMAEADAMAEETPDLAAIAAADPSLDVRVNEEGEVDAMVMLSDVLFAFGDATLEPEALDVLAGVAEKLDGVGALEITGHTDAVGDDAYNLALGQRRADAVRNWLIANTDLTADILTAQGVGEADPILPNLNDDGTDNPEGRAANRRVEFTIPDAG
ncbi:OmpA family protein [Yoonia sp. I 8.24]|uniref:OmpA family protein n=1 Tax=Yoonia sp. I 8.24 TaxID=1537229 RepID=UPI001EDD0D48|nr:OmpA family protein [Yoonia sp. I 8.24]MCG3269135.1 OmpA family protein [Yoonia sp. I 8.24]